MAAGEDDTKLVELSKAVDLYQGDLYAGIFSDWCIVERERLARLYLQALGEMMYCHMRRNESAQAIDVGQTILNIDPLREEVHRALIVCYGCLGYRAEAVAQFQQCADYLMAELQVFPMPDTVVVYQQIMTSCLNNNLQTLESERLKEAYSAYADFQRAGDKFMKILHEIDELKSTATL